MTWGHHVYAKDTSERSGLVTRNDLTWIKRLTWILLSLQVIWLTSIIGLWVAVGDLRREVGALSREVGVLNERVDTLDQRVVHNTELLEQILQRLPQ
ncbi:MAG: hypothetical protein ACR2RB_02250 [Gammaproteobacteria bacterium]